VDTAERYEQLIAYLSSRLTEPVDQHEYADGSLQFTAGDPPEVLVLLTDTSVIVSAFSAMGEAPHGLIVKPRRVGVLKWRRLPENELFVALAALLKGARETRTAQFRVCEECGRGTPPERLSSDSLCQDCADRRRRLIH
jgi:hypothetical protein